MKRLSSFEDYEDEWRSALRSHLAAAKETLREAEVDDGGATDPCRWLDGVAGLVDEVCTGQGALDCSNPMSEGTSLKVAPQLYGRDGTSTIETIERNSSDDTGTISPVQSGMIF